MVTKTKEYPTFGGMILKGCPRCGGDLFVEKDASDADEVCLQCGYRHLVYRDFRRALPINGNTGKMLGRFRGGHLMRTTMWNGSADNSAKVLES